jgi:hypothetical protein
MNFNILSFTSQSEFNQSSNLLINHHLKKWGTSTPIAEAYILIEIDKEEEEEVIEIEIGIKLKLKHYKQTMEQVMFFF